MNIFEFTANRIKNTAIYKGISIKQLLNNCDLSINTISEMSKGKQISYISLAKIAACLDCSVDYLLGRTDIPKVVNDIPKEVINTLTQQYSKAKQKFISDYFIKPHNKTKTIKNNFYYFDAEYYDDYIDIFNKAYIYAKEHNIKMQEAADIYSKDEYINMADYRSDFAIETISGKYYTITSENYNKFCNLYKLYIKAYTHQLLNQ